MAEKQLLNHSCCCCIKYNSASFSATPFQCEDRESGDLFATALLRSSSQLLSSCRSTLFSLFWYTINYSSHYLYSFQLIHVIFQSPTHTCWLSRYFPSSLAGERKHPAPRCCEGWTDFASRTIGSLWCWSWHTRFQWENSSWLCKVGVSDVPKWHDGPAEIQFCPEIICLLYANNTFSRKSEWKWGISIFYFYFNYQITACVLGAWDISCDPNDTGCANLAAHRKLIRQEFLQVQAPGVGVDSGIAVGKGWVGAHGVEPSCESVMVDALKHVQCWLVLNVFLCPFLCHWLTPVPCVWAGKGGTTSWRSGWWRSSTSSQTGWLSTSVAGNQVSTAPALSELSLLVTAQFRLCCVLFVSVALHLLYLFQILWCYINYTERTKESIRCKIRVDAFKIGIKLQGFK